MSYLVHPIFCEKCKCTWYGENEEDAKDILALHQKYDCEDFIKKLKEMEEINERLAMG
jgi:hypothetical protein